jgi:hypothetical protein
MLVKILIVLSIIPWWSLVFGMAYLAYCRQRRHRAHIAAQRAALSRAALAALPDVTKEK